MGIETALLIGGGLIGNYISSQGAKKAAAAQAQGITDATGAANAYRDPYNQAGTAAMAQYQQNLTPQGRANFAQEYTQGPGYEQELARAEEASLRGSSAMGNMRAGAGATAFQAVQPQLINQAYGQQMQGLQGLMQQGSNMANASAGTAYQGGVAATNPQYQADTAMPNFWGNAVGTVAGAGADYFSGLNAAPATQGPNPWGSPYGNGVTI